MGRHKLHRTKEELAEMNRERQRRYRERHRDSVNKRAMERYYEKVSKVRKSRSS